MKESLSESDAQVVATWLQEARHGSTDALAEAFNHCQRYLRRRIRREIPRALQSKFSELDLLQAAYVIVQEAFADFQGTTAHEFLSWLFQITLHQASNFRRYYRATKKRAVERELSLETGKKNEQLQEQLLIEALPPDLEFIRREENEAFRQALASLPPRFRQVVALHGQEGMPFSTVGTHLHVSAEAARKIWVRALTLLKGHLAPYR